MSKNRLDRCKIPDFGKISMLVNTAQIGSRKNRRTLIIFQQIKDGFST